MRARPTREIVARTFSQLRAFYRNLAVSEHTAMRAIKAECEETKQASTASGQINNPCLSEQRKQ